jgi:hypothetical protein
VVAFGTTFVASRLTVAMCIFVTLRTFVSKLYGLKCRYVCFSWLLLLFLSRAVGTGPL